MSTQKPTAGRIVHYFPGTNEVNKLPNGMTHAPAIITQVFGETETALCNMTIFLAETDPNKKNIIQRWSVHHKSYIDIDNEGMAYWDWPARD